ncbi:hypothetical protein JCM10213v2_004605 [Rhodosporidiobolus nylandii]
MAAAGPHKALGVPAPTSAAAAALGSAIRPSPVVPPSPSVPPTPSFSRPTSPRPSEPASPTTARARAHSGGQAALGGQGDGQVSRSGSMVDLSHIFERDVEFAPSHLITPSEAVDVAVPPVLTEAAVALSYAPSDPITSHDLAALVLDAEHDAQAGSGWSSPVMPPGIAMHQPQVASPLHHGRHAHHANASRSPVRGARSLSPDSVGVGRAVSPDSSTTFSVGTPPTSNSGGSPPPLMVKQQGSAAPPPAHSLGPFGQRLAEALENEASKRPHGLASLAVGGTAGQRDLSPDSAASTSPTTARTAAKSQTYTPLKPSLLLPFPGGACPGGLADDPFSGFSPSSASASAISTSNSPLHSPAFESSNPFSAVPPSSSISPSSSATGLAQPHPRRLSFYSYADLINDERISELKGEGIAGGDGAATPGGLGVAGQREHGSRTASGSSAAPATAQVKAMAREGKEGEVEKLAAGVEGLGVSAVA